MSKNQKFLEEDSLNILKKIDSTGFLNNEFPLKTPVRDAFLMLNTPNSA